MPAFHPPHPTRRAALGLSGGAALSALLAGCGGFPGPAATAGAVDLSFWTHDPGYVDFFTGALPLVAELTPFQPTLAPTISGAGDLVTKLLAQAIAGTGTPDVAGLEIGSFCRMQRGSLVEELLVYMTPVAAELGDDLLPARVAPFSKDGKLYAFDSDNPMTVYYYRDDLFSTYGVPTPEEAGTWEEFLAAVTPVAEREQVSFAAVNVGSDPGGIVQAFQFFLLQRGGNLFTREGDLNIETPEAEDVLKVIVGGVQSGAIASVTDFYGGSIQNVLSEGRIAGIGMPTWYAIYGIKPNVPDQSGRWRVALLPRFAGGGTRTAVGGGTGFAALRDKPNTQAGIDLVKVAYLEPSQQVQRYKDLGYLPTRRSVYEDPEMEGITDEYFGGQDVFQIYKQIVDEAPEMFQSPNLPILNTVLSGRLLRAYDGDLTPAQALSEAAEDYRGQTRGTED